MKKAYIVVSLFVFGLIIAVSIFSGSNAEGKAQEEVVAEEEEVTNVVFFNPKVKIQEGWIEVEVYVSSSKGIEKLSRRFGIFHDVSCGYKCYSKYHQVQFAGVVTQQLFDTVNKVEGEYSYNVEKYEIIIKSVLPDTHISNRIYLFLPNDISVTKYGKKYEFERIDFSCTSVSNNIRRVDNKLFEHEISARIEYDYDYCHEFVLKNEIFHIN